MQNFRPEGCIFAKRKNMKINWFKLFSLGLVILGTFINGPMMQAQTISEKYKEIDINAISTSVPFLMIAPDARAGAMGDVGVATSPDANSIHWNPAKLANIDKRLGFALSYTPWLHALVPDINLAYLSGYGKVDKNSGLGISILYFSLGSITFTDNVGTEIGQFTPNELAISGAYGRKLDKHWSGGLGLKYIRSNLTGGQLVEGVTASRPGWAVAADVSVYYENLKIKFGGKKGRAAFGLAITNMGNKISYTETGNRDFIPTNLRIGGSADFNLDEYNTLSVHLDLNKLLVPTQPQYKIDPVTLQPERDPDGNKVVEKGKDPNVSVTKGMLQSFSDAPGGGKEELREINPSLGLEYWYDKQFSLKAGMFYEHPTKGNRKYITVGAGLRYNVFGLDFAYLIPLQSRNPLENTLRFTLLFDFEAFKSQNKADETE